MLIDAIPIYLDALDIENYHSIIKISDYETVEELITYIKMILYCMPAILLGKIVVNIQNP